MRSGYVTSLPAAMLPPFQYIKAKTNHIIKTDLYNTIKSDKELKISGETIASSIEDIYAKNIASIPKKSL